MNTNPLIRETKEAITNIKGQIATHQYIIASKDDNEKVDVAYHEKEIEELNNNKLLFKAQLKRIKAEIEKAEIEQESKGIEDRSVTAQEIICLNNEKINNLEVEILNLINELKTLKFIEEEGSNGVHDEVIELEKKLSQKNKELEELKIIDSPEWLAIDKNLSQQNKLKAQIDKIEETTNLKTQLMTCKRRLKELHKNLNGQIIDSLSIQKEEELIKSEMKNIIKDIIHSESFSKIKTALNNTKDIAANHELLKNEGIEISEEEFNKTKSRIEELEIQLNAEMNKVKLQSKLKKAREELINLESCVGIPGLEDISNNVNELKTKITSLDSAIAEITTRSLNLVKPTTKEIVQEYEEVNTTQTTTVLGAANSSSSSATLMAQEVQKWLAENMLNEALDADVKEVIVSAALLNLARTKGESSTAQTVEEQSTRSKIKAVAVGACEKFCMSQLLQSLAWQNPLASAAYLVGIIGNHCILGDRQLSTLMQKVKSFMIGETIKLAGTTILGGLVTGTVGTLAAVPAGLYLTYNVGSQLKNKMSADKGKAKDKDEEIETQKSTERAVNPIPTQHLAAAALDMVADLTVASIYGKICS